MKPNEGLDGGGSLKLETLQRHILPFQDGLSLKGGLAAVTGMVNSALDQIAWAETKTRVPPARIHTLLSEYCTNVVENNLEKSDLRILVQIFLQEEGIAIVVRDNGVAWDPVTSRRPLSEFSLRARGGGLHLIEKNCSSFEVLRGDGGNVGVMCIDLAGSFVVAPVLHGLHLNEEIRSLIQLIIARETPQVARPTDAGREALLRQVSDVVDLLSAGKALSYRDLGSILFYQLTAQYRQDLTAVFYGGDETHVYEADPVSKEEMNALAQHVIKPVQTGRIKSGTTVLDGVFLNMTIGDKRAFFHFSAKEGLKLGRDDMQYLELVSKAATKMMENFRLFNQLSRDALTGAFSRAHLTRILSEMSEKPGRICLVMSDLDHFKTINDTYGHDAGDTALIRYTEIVNAVIQRYIKGKLLQKGSFAARYGGEEFISVLVIEEEDPLPKLKLFGLDVMSACRSIRIQHGSEEFGFTTSVGGVAVEVTEAMTTEPAHKRVSKLVQAVDATQYQAKRSDCGDCGEFFEESSRTGVITNCPKCGSSNIQHGRNRMRVGDSYVK